MTTMTTTETRPRIGMCLTTRECLLLGEAITSLRVARDTLDAAGIALGCSALAAVTAALSTLHAEEVRRFFAGEADDVLQAPRT